MGFWTIWSPQGINSKAAYMQKKFAPPIPPDVDIAYKMVDYNPVTNQVTDQTQGFAFVHDIDGGVYSIGDWKAKAWDGFLLRVAVRNLKIFDANDVAQAGVAFDPPGPKLLLNAFLNPPWSNPKDPLDDSGFESLGPPRRTLLGYSLFEPARQPNLVIPLDAMPTWPVFWDQQNTWFCASVYATNRAHLHSQERSEIIKKSFVVLGSPLLGQLRYSIVLADANGISYKFICEVRHELRFWTA